MSPEVPKRRRSCGEIEVKVRIAYTKPFASFFTAEEAARLPSPA